MSNLTDEQIKAIVKSEMKKILKDEMSKGLKAALKTGDFKKETNNLIKNALTDMYKFMWNRKTVWQSEIGK